MWEEVPGFSNYEVSDEGEVRNATTGRIIALGTSERGHKSANIYDAEGRRISVGVAALVLTVFSDSTPFEGDVAYHLDLDLSNNHIENLVWKPKSWVIEMGFQRRHAVAIYRHPVVYVPTNEVYPNSLEAANAQHQLEIPVAYRVQRHLRYGEKSNWAPLYEN